MARQPTALAFRFQGMRRRSAPAKICFSATAHACAWRLQDYLMMQDTRSLMPADATPRGSIGQQPAKRSRRPFTSFCGARAAALEVTMVPVGAVAQFVA
jgi:hypothetical protein